MMVRSAKPRAPRRATMTVKTFIGITIFVACAAASSAAHAQWRGRPVGPGVRVRVAPPAARVEVRVAAPSPRHVWIPGYWEWQGGRHVWIVGRWELPPAPNQ